MPTPTTPLTNTATRYGTIAKVFHWSIALCILTLIPSGIVANGLDPETQLALKARLFSMHKTLGVAVFFIALARIAWALNQPRPVPLHPDRQAETWVASLVHWLLYGSLVLVPLTGWVHHASTSGFAPIKWPFGQSLPFVPKSEALAHTTAALHIIFERVLAASVLLHVAGALKHAVIDRDATLSRMWFGRTSAGTAQAAPHGRTAPVVAVGVWAAALAIGAGLGLFAPVDNARPQAATLEQVASDWAVQSGEISLTVALFGEPTTGRFPDWTSQISYDPDSGTGQVTTTIAVGAFDIGSVTSDALAEFYLAADAHPTAQFTGQITRDGAQHTATGTLTLKGIESPVSFPFDLSLDGGTATMAATLDFDRRDFGIGPDGGDTLAPQVQVSLSLTASLAAAD